MDVASGLIGVHDVSIGDLNANKYLIAADALGNNDAWDNKEDGLTIPT